MIKRFHQLNENIKGLKDVEFFSDFFSELLDEYEYELVIENINYIRHNNGEEFTYEPISKSNFPKEGFYPNYSLILQFKHKEKRYNLSSSEDLDQFTKICSSFSSGFKSMISTTEIDPKLSENIRISTNPYPSFNLSLCDIYEIPKDELPNQLFEEFFEAVDYLRRQVNKPKLFQIIKNEKENKLEVIGYCISSQLDAFLRLVNQHLRWSENEHRYKDGITFDVNVTQRKNKDNHIEFSNPKKVAKTY